jgi:hypothetical protein
MTTASAEVIRLEFLSANAGTFSATFEVNTVPEIDPHSSVSAVSLLVAALALVERRRHTRRSRAAHHEKPHRRPGGR